MLVKLTYSLFLVYVDRSLNQVSEASGLAICAHCVMLCRFGLNLGNPDFVAYANRWVEILVLTSI
jgi:hypothetical protein